MTHPVNDLTGAPDAEFEQLLARIEQQPAAEESVLEVGARAIFAAETPEYPAAIMAAAWETATDEQREPYRRLAQACLNAALLAGPAQTGNEQ